LNIYTDDTVHMIQGKAGSLKKCRILTHFWYLNNEVYLGIQTITPRQKTYNTIPSQGTYD